MPLRGFFSFAIPEDITAVLAHSDPTVKMTQIQLYDGDSLIGFITVPEQRIALLIRDALVLAYPAPPSTPVL